MGWYLSRRGLLIVFNLWELVVSIPCHVLILIDNINLQLFCTITEVAEGTVISDKTKSCFIIFKLLSFSFKNSIECISVTTFIKNRFPTMNVGTKSPDRPFGKLRVNLREPQGPCGTFFGGFGIPFWDRERPFWEGVTSLKDKRCQRFSKAYPDLVERAGLVISPK